jgi:nitrilase
VVGVNPVLHIDRIPAGFPDRDRLVPPSFLGDHAPWVEEGNTVIVGPKGDIIAGPVRQREETVFADLDMGAVTAARRFFDPVGHYNRPDVFRLQVDTSPRTAVIESARD